MAGAGWYNDEHNPDLARWHDGTQWTEHVVIKDLWEARGHAPPPPEELWPVAAGGFGRRRALVGAIAVVALVVVGGVAMAQDGDDEPTGDPVTEAVGQTVPTAGDAQDGSSAWGELSDVVNGVADATFLASVNQPADGVADDDTDASVSRSATSRPGGTTPTTIRRTETSTRSQSNPNPQTVVAGGDKESVGNTSTKTINDGYVPPPTTAAPSTTVAPETTTTVATTPDPPVGTPPETP